MALSWTIPSPTLRAQIEDHGRDTLPQWFFQEGGDEIPEALSLCLALARGQAAEWARYTYLEEAPGRWLDEHAKDRGTRRQEDETDEGLSVRLQVVEDMVTRPSLISNANRILQVAGIASSARMTELAQDGAYFGDSVDLSSIQAYMGDATSVDGNTNGYRMTSIRLGFVLILPSSTTTPTADAIDDSTRQRKAGGINNFTEIGV